MRRTREQYATACFDMARLEVKHVRNLDAGLRANGKQLSNYLKEQAVMMARYYVRAGRRFLHTNERADAIIPRRDLRPWA
jgi:hypothetical protein